MELIQGKVNWVKHQCAVVKSTHVFKNHLCAYTVASVTFVRVTATAVPLATACCYDERPSSHTGFILCNWEYTETSRGLMENTLLVWFLSLSLTSMHVLRLMH